MPIGGSEKGPLGGGVDRVAEAESTSFLHRCTSCVRILPLFLIRESSFLSLSPGLPIWMRPEHYYAFLPLSLSLSLSLLILPPFSRTAKG